MPTHPNFGYIAKMRDWKGEDGPGTHWEVCVISHALRLPPRVGELSRFASREPIASAWAEFKQDYLARLFKLHEKDLDDVQPGDSKGLGSRTDDDGGNYNRPVITAMCSAALSAIRGTDTSYENDASKRNWQRKDHYVKFIVCVMAANCEPGARWGSAADEEDMDWDEDHLKMLCLLTAHILDSLVSQTIYKGEHWYDAGDRVKERGPAKGGRGKNKKTRAANEDEIHNHEPGSGSWWTDTTENQVRETIEADNDRYARYESEIEPDITPVKKFKPGKPGKKGLSARPESSSSRVTKIKKEPGSRTIRQKRTLPSGPHNPRAHTIIKKERRIKREG